jgi:hypothetical protein
LLLRKFPWLTIQLFESRKIGLLSPKDELEFLVEPLILDQRPLGNTGPIRQEFYIAREDILDLVPHGEPCPMSELSLLARLIAQP